MRIGNWDVLIAALEMAIREPKLYNQQYWARVKDCGTVRCIAGWIAHFGGWLDDEPPPNVGLNGGRDIFTVSNSVHKNVVIEHAALISLDLDPELYGEIKPLDYATWVDREDPLTVDTEFLSHSLFGGGRRFSSILEYVRDLARADGVTLPPVILDEMEKRGIPA